jgi:hypothetical protein
MDTPADEAVAARVPLARRNTLHRIALVLQVSSLPGTSDQEKFYYDPFANIKTGDFAAAHAFFIHHGHTVVYHECPNTISFQELFPLASIGYISSLPEGLLAKGHELLTAQRRLIQRIVHAPPLSCILDQSLIVMWPQVLGFLWKLPLFRTTPLWHQPPLWSPPLAPEMVSFGLPLGRGAIQRPLLWWSPHASLTKILLLNAWTPTASTTQVFRLMGGIDLFMGGLSIALGGMGGILFTTLLVDVTTLLRSMLSLSMGGIMSNLCPSLATFSIMSFRKGPDRVSLGWLHMPRHQWHYRSVRQFCCCDLCRMRTHIWHPTWTPRHFTRVELVSGKLGQPLLLPRSPLDFPWLWPLWFLRLSTLFQQLFRLQSLPPHSFRQHRLPWRPQVQPLLFRRCWLLPGWQFPWWFRLLWLFLWFL